MIFIGEKSMYITFVFLKASPRNSLHAIKQYQMMFQQKGPTCFWYIRQVNKFSKGLKICFSKPFKMK